MFINDLFNESNEMDTPEFQAALLAMKKRASKEPPVDLKRLRQRMDAAERIEAEREKRKQERRAGVEEDSWHAGSNDWTSEHDQWTKENSNNPVPVDSASAIPGRVGEGMGVFNIGDQVLYKGQPAEVIAVDGTAATIYVPNWKAVPGMVDDKMEVDPASKFLNPMDPAVAEGSDNLAIGQQMARDGIEYDPAQEGEIISQIGDYLKRSGMTPRQIRGYMIDNDFVSDQLSYLPRKSDKKGVAEAFIPSALSAANANAEFKRKAELGNTYGSRVDLEVDNINQYRQFMQRIKQAAKLEGEHVECGLSGNKMSVYSKTMSSEDLDAFVENAIEEHGGVDEGRGDVNRLEHRGAEYNVYFNTGKGMYTARGTGQMSGQIAPQWFRTLDDAIDHAEMEIGGYDEHDGVSEGESQLYKHHQELRKKSGLPDPEVYKQMMKQKQAEIDALNAEIEADKKGVAEAFPHDVDHMPGATRNDLAKEIQKGCKRCGGHLHVYKDETGKVSQNNFPGAKKYKCGACAKKGLVREQDVEEVKQRLDAKCWKGKHKEGTKIKGGVRVNNCVPNESIEESTNYWYKLQAERNIQINSLLSELQESIKDIK